MRLLKKHAQPSTAPTRRNFSTKRYRWTLLLYGHHLAARVDEAPVQEVPRGGHGAGAEVLVPRKVMREVVALGTDEAKNDHGSTQVWQETCMVEEELRGRRGPASRDCDTSARASLRL